MAGGIVLSGEFVVLAENTSPEDFLVLRSRVLNSSSALKKVRFVYTYR
jgi:hypothetical protein